MANKYLHHKTRLNKKIRNFIMFFLILSFFILTPILILYTSGYSYDFKERKIVKTGVLSIDIKPKDSQVYFDSTIVAQSMPIRLYNKIPGTYNLKLEKEGYKSWEKDVVISSNQTTYIKGITLIKESEPVKILTSLEKNILNIYSNHLSKNIIILTSDEDNFELYSYDKNNEKITSLLKFNSEKEVKIEVSPFLNILYLEFETNKNKNIYLLNLDNPENFIANLDFPKQEELKIKWQKDADNPIFISNSENIYKISSNKKEIITTTSNNIFLFDDNKNLWIFDEKLFLINTSNEKEDEKYFLNDKIEEIIDINKNRIIARSDRETIIYNIVENKIQEKRYLDGVNFHFFNKEWWVISPWEINAVYENGKIELINRGGYKILDLYVFDEDLNFLIKTDQELIVFNPGYFISTKLIESKAIENIITEPKKRVLFYLEKSAEQSSVYKLEY